MMSDIIGFAIHHYILLRQLTSNPPLYTAGCYLGVVYFSEKFGTSIRGIYILYLDPGRRLAVHIQQVGSSPQTMFSALADSMKHFAPLRLSNPKLCRAQKIRAD
jgi:hypothetical protein